MQKPVEFIIGSPDEEQARTANFVLCVAACPREELLPPLRDNVFGPCSGGCGTELMWRPDAVDAPKICMGCALKTILSGAVRHVTSHLLERAALKAYIHDLRDEIGLTKGPEALRKALTDEVGPLPQPGEAGHEAFREGAAFAIGLLFSAFHAEQEHGALTDLARRHHNVIAVLLNEIDETVSAGIGVDEDGDPVRPPKSKGRE